MGGRGGGQIYAPGVNLKSWAVSNGLSLVTLKSEEFTLSAGSFKWEEGEGGGQIYPTGDKSEKLSYFKWALIGHIEKWRVHSVLWQFWMGGRGFRFTPLGGNLENLSSRTFRCGHQKGLFASRKTNNIIQAFQVQMYVECYMARYPEVFYPNLKLGWKRILLSSTSQTCRENFLMKRNYTLL